MKPWEATDWYLSERHRNKDIKRIEKKLQHWDWTLRLLWNSIFGMWEVWSIDKKLRPYMVARLQDGNGKRLVPGICLSAESIMTNFIRPRNQENKHPKWVENFEQEQRYLAQKKDRNVDEDVKYVEKEWAMENKIKVRVPDNLEK